MLFPSQDAARKYGLQEARLGKYLAKIFGASTQKGGRGRGLIEWCAHDEDNFDSGVREGCLGTEVERVVVEMWAPVRPACFADSKRFLTHICAFLHFHSRKHVLKAALA